MAMAMIMARARAFGLGLWLGLGLGFGLRLRLGLGAGARVGFDAPVLSCLGETFLTLNVRSGKEPSRLPMAPSSFALSIIGTGGANGPTKAVVM